ncbi:MAG: hypothetical protein LWY06_00230 [Firmicutes bacterium]|nr:hypothetical protein [Bacillota bacterium]
MFLSITPLIRFFCFLILFSPPAGSSPVEHIREITLKNSNGQKAGLVKLHRIFDDVLSLAVMPDGQTVAVSSGDEVHLYDLKTNRVENNLRIGFKVTEIIPSVTGRYIGLTGAEQYGCFDLAERKMLFVKKCHGESIITIGFLSDDEFLCAGYRDETAAFPAKNGNYHKISTYNLKTGKIISEPFCKVNGWFDDFGIKPSPDGKILQYISGGMLFESNLTTGKPAGESCIISRQASKCFYKKGKFFKNGVLGTFWDNSKAKKDYIYFLNLKTATLIKVFDKQMRFYSFRVSQKGNIMVVTAKRMESGKPAKNMIKIISTDTWKELIPPIPVKSVMESNLKYDVANDGSFVVFSEQKNGVVYLLRLNNPEKQNARHLP